MTLSFIEFNRLSTHTKRKKSSPASFFVNCSESVKANEKCCAKRDLAVHRGFWVAFHGRAWETPKGMALSTSKNQCLHVVVVNCSCTLIYVIYLHLHVQSLDHTCVCICICICIYIYIYMCVCVCVCIHYINYLCSRMWR